MERLTDEQLNEELAIEITIMPGDRKLTIFASGRIDGLMNLLDVAYTVPKEHCQLAVVNYIPDLMKDHRPRHERGTYDLGFKLAECENGGWMLADYQLWNSEWTRYVATDAEGMYAQMRAWTERQIRDHRKHMENRVRGCEVADAFFQANRIAAGARVDE